MLHSLVLLHLIGRGGGRGGVVRVLVKRPSPCVHEEVGHRRYLETQLLRNGGLHLLGRPLGLLKDGHQRAPLDVCEHQPRLLGPSLLLLGDVVFTLTCYKTR